MTADAAAPSLAALRSIAARLADRPIVVVGDVMLDQFTIGRVQRISPEAPVPVVEHIGDEVRLGGAANVAHNIRALGATPRLVGVVGADDAAATLRGALDAAGIAGDGLVTDRARPTTRKVRIVTTRHQQVARVDYESDAEASGDVEAALLSAIDRAAVDAAVIVVSDYLKGAVTPGLMAALAERRARTGVAVLVDPKIPHLASYAGASLITPNHHEAELATQRRIRTDADAREAARAFRALGRSTSVMITRGEHGLWLAEGAPAAAGQAFHDTPMVVETNLPARAREVADVTGAGDTVIATLAVALASGATLLQAAELANRAAGVAVGKFGPAAVTSAELLAALT
jgi:rfaE bifunctional protein kinase chain/domain